MGRTKGSGNKSTPNRAQPNPPSASLENLSAAELAERQANLIEKHGKAESTRKAYKRYLRQGQEFVESLIAKETEQGRDRGTTSSEMSSIESVNADYTDALSGPPKEKTPEALALFITQKCVEEKKKQSTADGIRSAFKDYWHELPGGKYQKDCQWLFNEVTKEWVGNPAGAVIVLDTMKALKKMYGADGTVRQHSRAMRIEYMDKIIKWSERVCPVADVQQPPSSLEERAFQTIHLQIRAFFSTAFTIWPRCDELIKLRRSEIVLGCIGPPPYNQDHFLIHLVNRKGWQNKLEKNELSSEANTFAIYDQPDYHCINCYFHLLKYLTYLELYHYEGKTQSTDFLFPAISSNKVTQRGQHITTDTVQGWLHQAVTNTEIDISSFSFSTHCFRRGGAQFRFMYAPIGKRWTIGRIRVWGGWAEREGNDTLLRYLVDELEAAEESHTHALCPTAPDFQVSLMGEHVNLELVTKGELRSMSDSLRSDIQTGFEKISHDVNLGYDGIQQGLSSVNSAVATINGRLDSIVSFINSTNGCFTSVPVCNRNALTSAERVLNQAVGNTPSISLQLPESTGSPIPQFSITSQPQQTPIEPDFTVEGRLTGLNNPPAASAARTPVVTYCVPKLPIEGHKSADALYDILHQWENADDRIGLPVALKDWPHEWYNGRNRRSFNAMHNLRKQIALEYIERFQRDDAAFKAAYSEWDQGHCKLYEAIKKARKAREESTNQINNQVNGARVANLIRKKKQNERIAAAAA